MLADSLFFFGGPVRDWRPSECSHAVTRSSYSLCVELMLNAVNLRSCVRPALRIRGAGCRGVRHDRRRG